MNKRILPFAVAALALTLASCSDNETEVATFANTYEQTLAQSDSASVQIVHSVEYYKSFEGGNALKKKINNSIVKACFGDRYDGFSVEEASDAVSDTLMANYQREAGSVYDDAVAYAKEMELDHYYDPAMTCNGTTPFREVSRKGSWISRPTRCTARTTLAEPTECII